MLIVLSTNQKDYGLILMTVGKKGKREKGVRSLFDDYCQPERRSRRGSLPAQWSRTLLAAKLAFQAGYVKNTSLTENSVCSETSVANKKISVNQRLTREMAALPISRVESASKKTSAVSACSAVNFCLRGGPYTKPALLALFAARFSSNVLCGFFLTLFFTS
jgi:hypothetical protein